MSPNIAKMREQDWSEISFPVQLMAFAIDFSVVEEKLSLRFDSEEDDEGIMYFCFAEVSNKKIFFESRGKESTQGAHTLVSVLSYETDWQFIIDFLIEKLSINKSDLMWVQSELSPSQWEVGIKTNKGNEKYFFPDESRAKSSVDYFKSNAIEVLNISKIHLP